MASEIAALIVAFGTIAAVALWTVVTGSPPTPTSLRVRRTMLLCCRRAPRADRGRIYELGSGWGGLSLCGCRSDQPVVSIELSPLPLLVAWTLNMAA